MTRNEHTQACHSSHLADIYILSRFKIRKFYSSQGPIYLGERAEIYFGAYIVGWPVSVAARPKAWVCGRSLVGIVASEPAGSFYTCLLWVMCVVEVSASGWSLVQRSPTESSVSECDCVKPSFWGRPRQLGRVGVGGHVCALENHL